MTTDRPTNEYCIVGVNRESGEDCEIRIHAWSEENARVKAELQGMIPTSVESVGNQVSGEAPPPEPEEEKATTSPATTQERHSFEEPGTPWEEFDPEEFPRLKAEILEGVTPGQVRGERYYRLMDGGKWSLADWSRVNLSERHHISKVETHHINEVVSDYADILLPSILHGNVDAHWGHRVNEFVTSQKLEKGWLYHKSPMVVYKHPIHGEAIHPFPHSWNWIAFLGTGIWAIVTRTWTALWFVLLGGTSLWMIQAGQDVEYRRYDDELLGWGTFFYILTRLLFGGLGNRLRHNTLINRGYKVVAFVSGSTRDAARARLANMAGVEKDYA